jgi:hypothetical protein
MVWPLGQIRFDDAPDLACVGNAAVERLSYGCGLAATLVIPLALWYRSRAAAEGQHGTWAAIAALAGVLQVIAMLYQVAPGCLSGHALSIFVGSATPWFVVAVLFRGAVAPLPPSPRSGEGTSDDRGRMP